MANLYRNSNDKWRAYGYQKAITTLKKCQRSVTTYEVRIDIVRFESFFFFFFIQGNSNVTRHWLSFS